MFDSHNPYTILLAPNASLMTGRGTNTIVFGGGEEGASVIDPADDALEHQEAIIRAGEQRGGIRRILITHGHPDHIGGAVALRKRLRVSIYAFSRQGTPIADEEVPDGTMFPAGNDLLRAIHTPGHSPDHFCFLLELRRTLFAGDLVAGEGTVVIGDLSEYLASLECLQLLDLAEIVPAHGPIITNPQAKLSEYVAHRREREQQVVQALQNFPTGTTVSVLVSAIYSDVDVRLHSAAAHSVNAHLRKLEREGRVKRGEDDVWQIDR
jgi:glyoxylase-like metal-dependent hydrolase (beta-lactamase superfamily II)